jgi:hypothetical protein
MPEIKVECDCGQKYKFDVEPVNGRMPFKVNCPSCGNDGTSKADIVLQSIGLVPSASVAARPGLRISSSTSAPAGPSPPMLVAAFASAPAAPPLVASRPTNPMSAPPIPVPPLPARPFAAKVSPKPAAATGSNNILLGIVGIVLGTAVGSGLMYGFFLMTGFRFPLLGVGIGFLTGLGGRLLYRGTDNSLGVISAVVAAISVIGTLYFIYGEFPILSIISVVVSISVAYRVASG